MRGTAIRIAVLLVTLASAPGHTQNAAPFSEEMHKQEGIYASTGNDVPKGYTTDRTLELYKQALSPGFGRTLQNLGPEDRWLDIGAGKGQAILDYFAGEIQGQEHPKSHARAIAMSIEDRRTPVWKQSAERLDANEIQYLHDRSLQDYTSKEIGRFQLITDVMGGFSYSLNLSEFMEKVLGFLQLYGNFYTVLQDVRSEQGTNKPYYANANFLTQIANPDGSDLGICGWLKSISCVEVTCSFKPDWRPPVETYHVEKICDDVRVPPLVPVAYKAGTPPERQYQIKRETQARQ
jgi:hypothetical protein